MVFAGLKKPAERKDLIAYLKARPLAPKAASVWVTADSSCVHMSNRKPAPENFIGSLRTRDFLSIDASVRGSRF